MHMISQLLERLRLDHKSSNWVQFFTPTFQIDFLFIFIKIIKMHKPIPLAKEISQFLHGQIWLSPMWPMSLEGMP